MRISRKTVDKLGIKLYDKASAVVSELIANAHDADATEVEVSVPLRSWLATKVDGEIEDKGYEIVVEDNGHGMTQEEVNAHYLMVGTDRREDPERRTSRELDRPVMGRKGIGKFAPFGICRTIEVWTAGGPPDAEEYPVSHLIMRFDEITADTDQPYHPDPGEEDGSVSASRGTKIILRDFLPRVTPDAETFSRQIAARFGLRQKEFVIEFKDTRHGKDGVVGEVDIALQENTRFEIEDGNVRDAAGNHILGPPETEAGRKLPVDGWVGLSKGPYKHEEIAGIRVFTRGKIATVTRDFGHGAGFTGEHTIRSYLVGQIWAEWLDEDEGDDLVRTDRQDILWSTEAGAAFQAWGQELIRKLGERTKEQRRKGNWELFFERSNVEEEIARRFTDEEVKEAALELAKTLGGSASRDELEEEGVVEDLVSIVVSVAPHRDLLNQLRRASTEAGTSLSALATLFSKARIAERASLGQIVEERLKSIDKLEKLIDDQAAEAELQAIVESAPWLIDPHYTLLAATRTLNTVRKKFEAWYEEQEGKTLVTSAIQNPGKIPDFVLVGLESELLVVEIKSPGHSFKDNEWERAQRYYDALEEFLEGHVSAQKHFPDGVRMLIVCDGYSVGQTTKRAMEALESGGDLARLKWRDVLDITEQVHDEFLSYRDEIEEVAPSSSEDTDV